MRLFRFVFIAVLVWVTTPAFPQSAGSLRGKITDPSGAVVRGAAVTATSENGQPRNSSTNNLGEYEFSALPPGSYTVSVRAQGFALYEQPYVRVTAGDVQRFDVTLGIFVEKEKIDVQDEAEGVDTAASSNAGAIVIKGKDLDALSDNPDDLQSELEALAGPTAGPNGGQIYIDGFTGGQLPPKSSIREIRINQNPFSAEYDKLGYGRIEILTKPGTDKVHGRVMMNGNTSALNTGNPFAKSQPDYHSTFFMGSVGGPLNKRASYFISMFRRDTQSNAIVNASGVDAAGNLAVDANGNPQPLVLAVLTPRSRTDISPRFDFQLTPSNTLTVRYSYHRSRGTNGGIGQFNLPSMGFNSESEEHEIEFSDTQVLSPRVINETHFEYSRERSTQTPLSSLPTIMVRGAFTAGGSQQGSEEDLENYFEVQNSTSVSAGTHLYKFGVRLRDTGNENTSTDGFNGAFVFDSFEAYRNGTPSQFSITTGNPRATVNLLDAGLFFQDDWKMRP